MNPSWVDLLSSSEGCGHGAGEGYSRTTCLSLAVAILFSNFFGLEDLPRNDPGPAHSF